MSDNLEALREAAYLREIVVLRQEVADMRTTLACTLRQEVADMRAELDGKLIPNYVGIWKGGEFLRGSIVTYQGACWIATMTTSDKPGDGETAWRLMMKSAKSGRSAYDIWRSLGNVGTERDFILSLRGKEGRQGPQGPPGRNASNVFLPDNSAEQLTEAMMKSVRGSRSHH